MHTKKQSDTKGKMEAHINQKTLKQRVCDIIRATQYFHGQEFLILTDFVDDLCQFHMQS